MQLSVVILAAGQGKRMHSDLPKVLQPLAGQPLLQHVIRTARALEPGRYLCGVRPRRRAGAGGAVARARRVGTAGRSAGHRPRRHAGHVRDTGRSHGTGAVRRRAADPDCFAAQARLPWPARARWPCCRSTSTMRAGYGRIVRDAEGQVTRHRRAQGREPGRAADPRGQHRPDGRARGAAARVAAGAGQQQLRSASTT